MDVRYVHQVHWMVASANECKRTPFARKILAVFQPVSTMAQACHAASCWGSACSERWVVLRPPHCHDLALSSPGCLVRDRKKMKDVFRIVQETWFLNVLDLSWIILV